MSKCKIVNAEEMAESYETNAKLDKLRSNKALHDMIHNDPKTQLDAKAPMKMSKSALARLAKGPKPRKQAKAVNLDRFVVEEYVYRDYTKALTTIIPNAVNRISFNNERFGSKLQKSNDLKHSIDKLFGIEITNDLMGGVATLGALIAEELVESKLGFNNRTAQEKIKAYDKEIKAEIKKDEVDLNQMLGDPSKKE